MPRGKKRQASSQSHLGKLRRGQGEKKMSVITFKNAYNWLPGSLLVSTSLSIFVSYPHPKTGLREGAHYTYFVVKSSVCPRQ